ncbi:MAG: hypothetical protein IKR48_01735 [Kiritimatiellae bacterium]|nr:hypothetical protein [Kiritimatiellia bacterium]
MPAKLSRIFRIFLFLCLFLLLAVVAILICFERKIPDFLLRRAMEQVDSEDFHISIEQASFSLRKGARLKYLKVYPKGQVGGAVLSAKEIDILFRLSPFIPLKDRLRKVRIVQLRFPELPPRGDSTESVETPELPRIKPFDLELVDPDVIGIKPHILTGIASVYPDKLTVRDISLAWKTPGDNLFLNASLTVNLKDQTVKSEMKGQVYPENILPLFSPAGIPATMAVKEIVKFQSFQSPVRTECGLDINFHTIDFTIRLKTDIGPCTYNGVPVDFVHGKLVATGTNVTPTEVVNRVQLEEVDTKSKTGRLSGSLCYTDNQHRIDFQAKSSMDLPELFDIIGVLNEDELQVIQCTTPPQLEAHGVVSSSKTMAGVTNHFSGTFTLDKGSILNFDVANATGDLRMDGFSATFQNLRAKSSRGGDIDGEIRFDFPEYVATQTVFRSTINFKQVDLMDVAKALNVTNEQSGKISGTMKLHSTTGKDALQKLGGTGEVTYQDGVITQIPLFAGFTAYLAKKIPGVSQLVDQSTGAMNFTITNGVLATENAVTESSLFSIKARGTYDMTQDHLDIIARANIFRQKSLVGKITHFVTFPFTRLLLEFHVFGSLQNTDWSYVNIIEQITGPETIKPKK